MEDTTDEEMGRENVEKIEEEKGPEADEEGKGVEFEQIEEDKDPEGDVEEAYPQERKPLLEKTLRNSNVSGAHENVRDLKVVGNGDSFRLLFKAYSENEGWMKSTKAMEIQNVGCIVQVTTQQKAPDGSYAVAEALTFVPGVVIIADENNGRKLYFQSLNENESNG